MKFLLVLAVVVSVSTFTSPVSAQVKLSFPPWKNTNCSFDDSVGLDPALICTPSSDGKEIIFSWDDEVISTRYQYVKPVRLFKKGTKVAYSFSTSWILNVNRDFERSEQRVFGGGFAFAITPDQLTRNAGVGSIGLFPINTENGKPLSSQSPKTVAVEIDTAQDGFKWDSAQLPHLGIDVNSLKSVKSRYLWNQTNFVSRKIGYFVDYDAKKESIEVRVQNITSNGKLNKKKSVLWLSYSGLKLSKQVNEYSYVGFSSRVPITTDGTYILYEWNFETKEVLTNKKQ
ncbi:hypothetical protein R1flu_006291 [Riccia fluitans]|uniref:Legume lectin domain-containing protein n=1 Tax=Riccia fluitans TaxID=41844 RepID=A0ABD1YYM4_9MARC